MKKKICMGPRPHVNTPNPKKDLHFKLAVEFQQNIERDQGCGLHVFSVRKYKPRYSVT